MVDKVAYQATSDSTSKFAKLRDNFMKIKQTDGKNCARKLLKTPKLAKKIEKIEEKKN